MPGFSDNQRLIDTHGHLFPVGLPDLAAETGDPRWPSLRVEGEAGRIMRGDATFRHVRASCWDPRRRLADLEDRAVDVQVISPVPVTLVDWADPGLATRFLAAQNDAIAQVVADSGGRLVGLGALPLQDPVAATVELRRVTGELGLAGVEVGTVNGGAELDDPWFRPVLEELATSGTPLFVHPVDGAGATRCSDPGGAFGLGMLTDTAVTARALVFGGVLSELPDLRVHLAHGGGTFPYAYPRLRLWAEMRNESPGAEELERCLHQIHVDSLVFDPALLALCVERYGPDRVMFGSDDPFIPWPAVTAPLPAADVAIRSGNAAALYGIPRPPSA